MKDYQELILHTVQTDPRFIVMTAENRALVRELPKLIGKRFIDTGITEQTMIGMAAGLALQGRIPICHALTSFLTMRAFEFIRTDVGIPNLRVKLSGFIPGVLSDANGPTHQAIEDISIMRGIPGMHVFAPGDANDMLKMLPTIWASEHPSYVRVLTQSSTYDHEAFVYGKAETLSIGTDANIFTYGFLFNESFKAWQMLNDMGISTGLINMRSLKPVDEEVIVKLAKQNSPMFVVEDHFKTGGLYSIVAEVLLKHQLTAEVHSISFNEKWFKPGLLNDVLELEKMNAASLKKTIITTLSKSTANAN